MEKNFSAHLAQTLRQKRSLTLREIENEFGEKGFAIIFLVLMALPALPIPTGGVTHIFEIVVMLLALELIAGRKSIWLPRRWRTKTIPPSLQASKTLQTLIRFIQKVETISRPRFRQGLQTKNVLRAIGFVAFVFTLFAFLAPPFSGLDTLPSLGVVLLSLGLVFEDAVVGLVGVIVGAIGIGLVLLLGRVVVQLF